MDTGPWLVPRYDSVVRVKTSLCGCDKKPVGDGQVHMAMMNEMLSLPLCLPVSVSLSLCYSVPHLPASESPARVKRAENTNTNRYVQIIKCIGRESPIHPTKVAAENIFL